MTWNDCFPRVLFLSLVMPGWCQRGSWCDRRDRHASRQSRHGPIVAQTTTLVIYLRQISINVLFNDVSTSSLGSSTSRIGAPMT